MPVGQHEERPWGSFEVLLDAPNVKVKRITVKAGKRFSLQRHQKRDEHWLMVSGVGVVTCTRADTEGNYSVDPDDMYLMTPFCRTKINADHIHRMEALRDQDVVFIEVQLGTYFGEDDIERFEDDYGRK